jgi:hypothetical protein
VTALEARRGRDGGKLNGKTINRDLSVVSASLDHEAAVALQTAAYVSRTTAARGVG